MICIVKIPCQQEMTLPENSKELLYALDKAMEDTTYTIVYKGNYPTRDINLEHAHPGEFSTFFLFEFPDFFEDCDILDKMQEQASLACSLELLERSEKHLLVTIDHWGFSFNKPLVERNNSPIL